MTTPRCVHLSASFIAALKACPTRARLGYSEGIRKIEDTDAQRIGTHWHAMHELYHNWLTQSSDKDQAIVKVVEYLNENYATPPASKTVEEFAVEREVLLNSFLGYQWYYAEDGFEVIHSELPFKLRLTVPATNMHLPADLVLRVGKIDHVIMWQGMIGPLERKSTTRSIGPDSDYWEKSQKDTQVSMYALALRDMVDSNELPESVMARIADVARFGNTLYDVWHKPTIKPKALSQKDTAEFLESGEYCNASFLLAVSIHPDPSEKNLHLVSVDGITAEVEMGKKGFSIKETPAMFGARLLQDITERPDFYFQRKEISRTDRDIQNFRAQLYAIYVSYRAIEKAKSWFENENQCRATYPCSYIPICYGPGADAVCDGTTVPNGFKRIFVDLTKDNKPLEEGE
jgi:hypothetical protein